MNNKIKHSILTALAVTLFLVLSQVVVAQTAADEVEIRPLFQSHDILHVRIEAPISTLMKEHSTVLSHIRIPPEWNTSSI